METKIFPAEARSEVANSQDRDSNSWYGQVTKKIAQLDAQIRRIPYVDTPPYSTSVLAAGFTITGAAGVYQDTGLSITLPAMGTYRINANVRSTIQGSAGTLWWTKFQLYNATLGAYVADSERLIAVTNQSGLHVQNTCPLFMFISVTASNDIKLYAARDGTGGPTWTVSNILSDAQGRTTLSFERNSLKTS